MISNPLINSVRVGTVSETLRVFHRIIHGDMEMVGGRVEGRLDPATQNSNRTRTL